MDLSSMLNHDDGQRKDNQQARASSSTASQSRPPSLPTLNTVASTPVSFHHQSADSSTPSAHLASPGPHSYGGSAGTAHLSSHFRSPAPYSQSPAAATATTPISSTYPNYPGPPRPTLSRTPSSNHEYFATVQRQTPTSSHSHRSAGGLVALPGGPSSFGSPAPLPHQQSSLLLHNEPGQSFHRPSSVASRGSGQEHISPYPPVQHPHGQHSQQHISPPQARQPRQQSLSVSPKTVLTHLPQGASAGHGLSPSSTPYHPADSAQFPSASNRSSQQDIVMQSAGTPTQSTFQQAPHARSQPPTENDALLWESTKRTSLHSQSSATDTRAATDAINAGQKRPLESSPAASEASRLPSAPAAKRTKRKEVPIWATRAKGSRPLPSGASRSTGLPTRFSKPTANGNGIHRQVAAPVVGQSGSVDAGLLGPWDHTFTTIIPYEELTRRVCDFFMQFVVQNQNLGGAELGGVAPGEGQLEIEARIGTIIDKKSKERLVLPILTESLVHPGLDVEFVSLMDEAQHKKFNQFLNAEVSKSRNEPKDKRKAQMEYTHTREVDEFYELPRTEIPQMPAALRAHFERTKHTPTLRVTSDQKSGARKAQIIKVRLEDYNVYCPSHAFDYRISVSMEMNWAGDVEALRQATGQVEGNKAKQNRMKDRMSYRHAHCQIDLTQVKGDDGKLRHELEVELSANQVQKQGQLVFQGKPNQYEDLVRGFVDNVRILVRTVK